MMLLLSIKTNAIELRFVITSLLTVDSFKRTLKHHMLNKVSGFVFFMTYMHCIMFTVYYYIIFVCMSMCACVCACVRACVWVQGCIGVRACLRLFVWRYLTKEFIWHKCQSAKTFSIYLSSTVKSRSNLFLEPTRTKRCG